MRRVVSVFLSHFPIDRLRHQGVTSPPGTPLVVAQHDGRRRVVAAACPAATALGLRAGQTVAHAQACVPGLLIAEADPAADAAALENLAQACLRYAPLAAPDPPDGLWIDVAGASHLLGGEAALLADLFARLGDAGYTARAAIADTPGAAHGWARFGPAGTPILEPGCDLAAALAPLPLAALRLPPEVCAALHRLGLDRIGQLAGAARAPFTRRFGALLLQRLDQALGQRSEPIKPVAPTEMPSHRLAFAEPLLTAESLAAAMTALVRAVCARLERAATGARRLDLLCERVDGSWQALRIGTARPSREAKHLTRLLVERLETLDPGLGIESMVLRAPTTERLAWSQTDGSEATASGSISELVDRLAGRLGEGRVFRAAPVASRIPERSVRRIPPLAPAAGVSWPPGLPRPARLFDPPQPVEAVALLPDHPPAAFVWRRVRHRVRRADGPERVRGEWWRRDTEFSAVRDYFAVEDEAGRRFWLFRRGDGSDPASGDLCWFLHGVF